ncbi:MAG: DUF502 domain-containing protein [Candidatus Thermoplasmatota archaeon]|nr:DUF502 domain-containing protein [Candidatus Thermoplasmatota archaeon]
MKRLQKFLWTTLIGGLGVLLPLILMAWVFYWLFGVILGIVRPISDPLGTAAGLDLVVAGIIAVTTIILLCFVFGLVIRTKLGNFFHRKVENNFLKKIPGYIVMKEVILHFSGEEEVPFSKVVLCKPFNDHIMMTGFITDRHPVNGYITVFIPTGPNPTSGNIYHIPEKKVVELNVSVEKGIKSVVGCGTGSKPLMLEYCKKIEKD